jgi:DNA modification methylase
VMEIDGCGRTIGPYQCCTIVTGDARELGKAIPDESIDLIFTDPVYDRIDDYRWLAETGRRVLKPDRPALVFCGIGFLPRSVRALEVGGLSYRWQGLWYQSNNMQRADMGFCNYSPFLWMEKGRSKVLKQTGDVANVPIPNGQHDHQWSKQPRVIARYTEAFTLVDALVLDPFCGGGTVPAACKMLGRHYLAFEVDPDVAERARERVRNTQPPLFAMQPEQLKIEECCG